MNRSLPALLALSLFAGTSALAQNTTAPAPATAPATAPSTRPAKTEATPPGFERVTVGRYSAFCQAVDESWIKQTLAQVKPDKMPTTRPADIIASVAQQRDALVKGLSNETGIDAAKINTMLDDDVLATLKKIDSLQPPVVIMVTTENTITSLLDSVWSNPRVSYNRLMKHVNYDDHIAFTIESPMDETLWFSIYDPADSPAERSKKLTTVAQRFDSEVAFSEASRARVVVRAKIGQFIEDQLFTPMKLTDDESWLHLGVTTWLTAKYSAMLTGDQAPQALQDLIFEPPNAFIKADSLDLLSLPDLNSIRPEFRFSYLSAARRKATLAVQLLVSAGGDDSIKKALEAIKKTPPKDGLAMVATIKAATAVDLTSVLRPAK